MKFFNRLGGLLSSPVSSFDKIQDYDDVKDIVRRALDATESYDLIFIGDPASGKTLFLQGIMDICKGKDTGGIRAETA